MNARGQSVGMVGIVRGGCDTDVRGALAVQPFEVTAILGQHGTTQRMSASQDVRVRSSQSAIFLNRQHIMSQLVERHDSGEREILIRVKLHSLLLH